MNDLPEKKNPAEPEQETVYYYSREHRMQRASASVRERNENPWTRPRLSKIILGNKGNVVILISVAVILVLYYLSTFYYGKSDLDFKLGSNNVNISIFSEDDILLLYVRKDVPASVYAYTGAVDIAVSPVQENGEETPVLTHRIFFTLDSPETYLVTLPFNGKKFMVALHTDFETILKTISLSAKSPVY